MNHNKLYARLLVDRYNELRDPNNPDSWTSPWFYYLQFIRSQSHKNNCYAQALRLIGG